MKTIIYKTIAKSYKIAEIKQDADNKINFIFESPINAKLLINGFSYDVKGGVASIDIPPCFVGELTPTLYIGPTPYKLEGFIVSNGAITKLPFDEEYIISIGKLCDELYKRTEKIEAVLLEIEEKISKKIKF